MAKHIVVDSLARSGTTLLSAVLRSQKKSISFCPGFNEPLACFDDDAVNEAHGDKQWPHGVCRKDFVINPNLNYTRLQIETLKNIDEFNQYYGKSKEDLFRAIIWPKNIESLHTRIAELFNDKDIFSYRWNQCLFYFFEWINRGDNYLWISLVRNPLDRACSSWKKHGWSFDDSIENNVSFAEKITDIESNKQLCILYYEDFVKEPEQTIRSIYDFIGEKIEEVNLKDIIGSNGKPFIPQSSDINLRDAGEKKDGYFVKELEAFSGFYTNKINSYSEFMNEDSFEVFKNKLAKYKIYERYF